MDGGHRAVIFDKFRGVQDDVVSEGTHVMIPFVQEPKIFDVRTQPRSIPVITPSRDQQSVTLKLRLLYRPRISALPTLFKDLGVDYAERILPSIGNEVLKAVVAQFDAEQLITQRERVSELIRERLITRANHFNIELDDVSIVDLTFAREFTQAVELKQVASQDAERAAYSVQQAEHEKTATIIRSEGDSEAAILVSKALEEHGSGLIELRKIDAQKEIAKTLARSRNVNYLPGGNGLLMNMNVG